MRKALTRDVDKKSVIPLPHPVYPDEVDWFVAIFRINDKVANKQKAVGMTDACRQL